MIRSLPTIPRLRHVATALLLVAIALPSVQANPVTSRAALGGTDSFLWGQLGLDEAAVVTPAALTSTGGGATGSVSNSGGDMTRYNNTGAAFSGNFAPGDQLLTNIFADGAITVDFTNPVAKVGAQIAAFDLGAFTGVIQVFDAADGLLEEYAMGGQTTFDQDNSALFLGVARAVADIDHVTFLVRGTDQGHLDFALNQLDFSSTGTGTGGPLPEPASVMLVGAALLALGRRRAGRKGTTGT